MHPNEITEVTRRALCDELALMGVNWAGRLSEVEFLRRIYDLSAIPSNDLRYRDALGDIQQHRVNWNDWPDDWIFNDGRFGLLQGRDELFLRFLTEMVHPVVRQNVDESRSLADLINRHLKADGWSIRQQGTISGRPLFGPARFGERQTPFPDPTGWQKVDRQLQEAQLRLSAAVNEEQFQAVGLLCREVLISVAQECFDPARHPSDPGPSATDAGRMIEAIFASELSGRSNEEARAHGKAALRLALALQHHRHADYKMAALCVEATASIVNLLAIIAGRRGP